MPSSPARPRTRRQATGVLAIATAGLVLAVTTTASAQAAPRPRPTTTTTTRPTTTSAAPTTTSPTTTTTAAPTTTSSSTTTTSAPTTTTTLPAPPTACGPGITKPDGTPWDCTFVDDFDGTSLDRTKWVPQQTATSGFTSGTDCVVDTPDNVSVSDGALHLTARKEAAPFTCTDPQHGDFTTQYTSASVSTQGRFSQTGGRFEVRAKFPPAVVKGLQESLWLWPDDPLKYGPWPTSGEIDIAEAYSLYPDRVIPYIHYVPKTWDWNVTNNYCLVNPLSDYHTYAAVWTTDSITITFDGQTCLQDVWDPALPLIKPQPFDHPFMVALTQALGQTANSFDPVLTPLPATTDVDYVHVWK